MDANWASKKFEKKIFLMCAKCLEEEENQGWMRVNSMNFRVVQRVHIFMCVCVCVYRICYVRLQTNSEFMQASREAQRRPRWRLKLSNSRDENGKTLMP